MIYIEDTYSAVPKSELLKEEPVDRRYIASGFPAASDDYRERPLNLHELLVHNAPATFFMRAGNNENEEDNICKGDLLVIDRSMPAVAGRLAVVVAEGGFSIRRLARVNGKLLAVKPGKQTVEIDDSDGFYNDESLFGIISYVVHPMIPSTMGAKKVIHPMRKKTDIKK
jgi:DNA polymerase V